MGEIVLDKQKELQRLKNKTQKYFLDYLKSREVQYTNIEDIVNEINMAFWEDIFVEANYEDFLNELREDLYNDKKKKNETINTGKWQEFFEEHIEDFKNYRGIERYNVDKDKPNERYIKIRNLFSKSVWERVYPLFLLQVHDFELKDKDIKFIEKIKKCYSRSYRKLYKMSLILGNKVDKKIFSLEDALRKEIDYMKSCLEVEDKILELEDEDCLYNDFEDDEREYEYFKYEELDEEILKEKGFTQAQIKMVQMFDNNDKEDFQETAYLDWYCEKKIRDVKREKLQEEKN